MVQSIHNLATLFNHVSATSRSLTFTPPFSLDEETHNDLVFIRPHHFKFPNTNLVGRLDNLTLCHAYHVLMDLSLVFREMQPSVRVGVIRQVALELLKYDDDMGLSESTERGFLLAADIVCRTSNVDQINRCLRFQFVDTEEDLINNARDITALFIAIVVYLDSDLYIPGNVRSNVRRQEAEDSRAIQTGEDTSAD